MIKIIVISGHMGSGKSTIAQLLREKFESDGYLTATLKFADTLYAMHDACLPILKTAGIRPQDMTKDGELLQILGTEYGRNLLGKNVWANALLTKLKSIENVADYVFIDDCRFENEFDILKDNPKAVTIRLVASEAVRKPRCSYWREKPHESETALDSYAEQGKFDIYIDTENNNTNEALFNLLEKLR